MSIVVPKWKQKSNLSLASMIASKICNNHKQHRIVLIEGKTGTGKSYAAVDLARAVSKEMAKRLGGEPEDYFTIDNVAIITPDEVVRVSKSIKKYGVYILDDIGVGLSSRKWQSDGNIALTNILQTFRTKNNLIILTVPDGDFIDKIARKLLHYKIVMQRAHFDKGYTIGKIYKVKKSPTKDASNNMYTFIREPGVDYTSCMFEKPEQFLCDEYDARREALQEELQEAAIQKLNEAWEDSKTPEISPKRIQQDNIIKQVKRINHLIKEDGMKVNDAIQKNMKEVSKQGIKGIASRTYYNHRSSIDD